MRHYNILSGKISKDFRFVLLSDLHNKDYGNDNQKLLSAIDSLNPDAVVIAGDLCNGLVGNDFSVAINLVRHLSGKYPIYYGMGNHEYRLKLYPDKYGSMWENFTQKLAETGVHIMDNEQVYLPENNIILSAVSIERQFYKRLSHPHLSQADMTRYLGESDESAFELLIAHDPEYFKTYADWGADLTVSGHVHGGIMRLPFIGGFVSPRIIEFPKYSGGMYSLDDKSIVVSCGLGTHTLNVRVFNPGELAVVDLKSQR